MAQSFVLSELRRFLLVGLCRVEMQRQSSELTEFLLLERRKLRTHLHDTARRHSTACKQTEGTRERRGGWALLSLGEEFDNILF
jgi:hypothetical protein